MNLHQADIKYKIYSYNGCSLYIWLHLIDWCFESNVYYEGETLKNGYSDRLSHNGCAHFCGNQSSKCTAFIYSNSRNSSHAQANCTLLMNVTKTIQRKTRPSQKDYLVSGKKCKDYDPFRTSLDSGISYLPS